MRFALALLALLQTLAAATPTGDVPAPDAHFGFRMGAERQIAAMADIEAYVERVAARSNRVRALDLGPTTGGHRTIAAVISAPDNIQNLTQIREANQRLAE